MVPALRGPMIKIALAMSYHNEALAHYAGIILGVIGRL